MTPKQLSDYCDFMNETPSAGTYSVHRFHFGNPEFLTVYLSTSTRSARDLMLEYWIESNRATLVEYEFEEDEL